MRTHALLFALVAFPAAASAQAPQPVDWSGWYAGAFAGWADGKLNGSESHESTTGDYEDNGFMAGLFGGYRHQTAEGWVFGGELIVPLHMDEGSAVDKEFYPDQVFYEAEGKYGLLLGAHAGKAMGRALPYVHGAIGFAKVEGRTLNVDLNENLDPGFVQDDEASPFVWQVGAGLDYQLSSSIIFGARVSYFEVTKADYTMPWNQPGPNKFGWSSILGQVLLSYRFGR
jgi:opacity protein-like surface antigen